MGVRFKDPRNEVMNDRDRGGVFVSQKTTEQNGIPQNFLTIRYLLFAYDVKRTTFQRRLQGSRGQTGEGSITLSRVTTVTLTEPQTLTNPHPPLNPYPYPYPS